MDGRELSIVFAKDRRKTPSEMRPRGGRRDDYRRDRSRSRDRGDRDRRRRSPDRSRSRDRRDRDRRDDRHRVCQ